MTIRGVQGNTAANGTFTITVIDGTSFSLNGTTGNGTYTTGQANVGTLTAVALAFWTQNRTADHNSIGYRFRNGYQIGAGYAGCCQSSPASTLQVSRQSGLVGGMLHLVPASAVTGPHCVVPAGCRP